MKKLLLFLALWSGVACAMQADVIPADVTSKSIAQELVKTDTVE